VTTRIVNRKQLALASAALVFLACWGITHTAMYQTRPERFTVPLLCDLMITAPLVYWLIGRNQKMSAYAMVRIALLGLLMATLLLSGRDRTMVLQWRRWLAPLAEIAVIGYIIWRFVTAGRKDHAEGKQRRDFIFTARQVLTEFTGHPRAANILASEVAVFYYAFAPRKATAADRINTFSNYQKSGIILVLYAFLGIFLVETIGMHFLVSIWSRIAAWAITALSMYSCLQLIGHIRALSARPIRLEENVLLIRHGLMGGDAVIPYDMIISAALTSRTIPKEDHLKIALVKGMEKHTIEIRTTIPVCVIRAFGIQKNADRLLLCIDEPEIFLEKLTEHLPSKV
jgi:hypothetical protein